MCVFCLTANTFSTNIIDITAAVQQKRAKIKVYIRDLKTAMTHTELHAVLIAMLQ